MLVEVLVSLFFLSVVSMGMYRSTLTSIFSREHSVRNSVAMQIATDSLEALAAVNPGTLSDDNDVTEESQDAEKYVTRYNVQYQRLIDVSVNSNDDSRTLKVTVRCLNEHFGGKAEVSLTLIPWGPA